MKVHCLFILFFLKVSSLLAEQPSNDTLLYFKDLTRQLQLKTPRLSKGEFELRLWVNMALVYGEAQELYIIRQKKDRLTLKRFRIYFDKKNYKSHSVTFDATTTDTSLWRSLVTHEVLTLPDGYRLIDEIRNKIYEHNRRNRDTLRVEIVNDSIRVVGKKVIRQVSMVDGTSYYTEVFGKNFFHKYRYHCPLAYSGVYKESKELRNASTIISLIFRAFREYDTHICQRLSPCNHRNACVQWGKNLGQGRQFYS